MYFRTEKSEILFYFVFGVLTTAVNVAVFCLLRRFSLLVETATIFAWGVSVLFAFITNRKFVFQSKSRKIWTEGMRFFLSRAFSGLVDFMLMHLLQKLMNETILKISVNIVVIILNFILCKIFVFGNLFFMTGRRQHD